MTYSRGTIRVAAAAVLLVAVTSCADKNNSPSPSEIVSSAPTAASTPSQTEIASKAASDIVVRYFSTVDLLQQQPRRPLTELATISVSTQLAAQKKLIQSLRKQGVRQVGDTKIVELKVQSINLDNSDPSTGRVPTAMIDVCWDVRKVDVLDKAGKSVVSPTRTDLGWTRYTVANYKWSSNPTDGWRVAGGKDLKQAPCDAS